MGVKIHGQTNAKYRRKPASILFSATAGDNTLHLRTQTGGFDCTISWGDGTTSICPVDGGNIIHNYANAGDYIISIFGNSFAGFYINGQSGRTKYKAIYSLGKWKVDTLTNLTLAFIYCENLIFVAENAFKYLSKLERIASIFRLCINLADIPANLFTNNLLLFDMSHAFRECTKLKIRDDIFGYDYANRLNIGKTIWVDNMFLRASFSGQQGEAPELWNFTTASFSKASCFGGLGNSSASLLNYADIPADWK